MQKSLEIQGFFDIWVSEKYDFIYFLLYINNIYIEKSMQGVGQPTPNRPYGQKMQPPTPYKKVTSFLVRKRSQKAVRKTRERKTVSVPFRFSIQFRHGLRSVTFWCVPLWLVFSACGVFCGLVVFLYPWRLSCLVGHFVAVYGRQKENPPRWAGRSCYRCHHRRRGSGGFCSSQNRTRAAISAGSVIGI